MGCVVLILILIALSQLQPDATVGDTVDSYRYHKDTLRCAIALDSRLGSTEGRGVGLNYDMLRFFGDYADAAVDIIPGTCDLSYIDSVMDGSVDILVMMNQPDSVLMTDTLQVNVSRLIRNNIHWVVAEENNGLLFMINSWLDDFMDSRLYRRTVAKYYRRYTKTGSGESGPVSPFDDLIKKYARETGIDWLLLSALMYQESQYYVGAEYKDAKGLMQVNEVTAARYGVSDLFSPEGNIKAGSYHLRYLMDRYRKQGLDSLNVIKFALASYNAGDTRIEQCRSHAQSQGSNPNDWEEVAATFKTNNRFMGATTTEYVSNIMDTWEELGKTVRK